jgi:lysophospholipase L1-like esterase
MVEQTEKPRRPRWKTLLFVCALTGIVLMLGLGGFEVVLRVMYLEQEIFGRYLGGAAFVGDDELGFRHAPGYKGRAFRRDAFDCMVEIQANGLRQANYDAQMEYPSRVLILGDSFTLGLGVEEPAAFPSLIQPPLNSRHIGVINAGQTAYCTIQEIIWGRRLVETVQPNAVVLCMFSENDVIGDRDQRHRNVEVKFGRRLRKDRWLPILPVDYLRTHSYVWMFAEHQYSKNTRERRIVKYQRQAVLDTQEFIQPTLDALLGFDEFCRQHDIKFGVVLIPSTGNVPFDPLLKIAFDKAGIPYVDLAQARLGPRYRLRGDAHWNERGHQEVARFIAPFCLRLVKGE